MSRSGSDYMEGLQDGRAVFINGERVEDVRTHPAFRASVRSVAALYDLSSDPANAEVLTAPSRYGGDTNVIHMIPFSREDLAKRRRGIRRLSEATLGFMGRTPDHVAGFLAGFAGNSHIFARGGKEYADNVVNFHRFVCENDLYLTYVIVPPQIDRSKPAHQQEDPYLYAGVREERDGGIVIKGAQMLGTGTAIADYIHLSTIFPLRKGDEDYAISVVIPVGAPGVKIYTRRSYAEAATSLYDYPLSSRFDETDSLVVFDDVLVPWEHVFVYRDLDLVQAQWWETPAHILGNTQSQIRFTTKLEFITGLAYKIASMNGLVSLPPVQGALGDLAAQASLVAGLVLAAEYNCEIDNEGVAWPGRAETFANMTLQSELYPRVLNVVRELCGGGLIQLPSSAEDFRNPSIAADLRRYVQSPGVSAEERVKVLKLAWDALGSEFGSRHLQYEMFYAGAPFVVKMRMFQNFDFDAAVALVDGCLETYDLDGPTDAGKRDGMLVEAPAYSP
jgi:4-hydroxyphenylacetate 3-monooxygenase